MPPKLKDSLSSNRGSGLPQREAKQLKSGQRGAGGVTYNREYREYDGFTMPMIVDKVLAPPSSAGASCEPMCVALQVLRERIVADPANLAKVGSKLAERSSAWASFLARVIHDEHNRLRRQTMATISWLMSQLAPIAAVDQAFQLFILNQRFIMLLTLVTEAPVIEIAQTILQCCQSQFVIETVVKNNEMPMILRTSIERLAKLGTHYLDSCTAMVMLAANLVGRHPNVAADMVDAKIDELLCQVGLRNIANLATHMGIVTQKAVLYCLRFFVRIRRENVPFCESCLSMCAHSIKALPNEATDLCGDVCAVMSNHATVAKSHPNVYLNVVTLATRMPTMSRAHFVFRLLKGLLPESEPNQQAGYAEYGFAAAMKLCRVGWIEAEPRPSPAAFRKETVSELLDLLIVCAHFGVRENFERRMNSTVMSMLRDNILATVKEERANLVKWARVQMYFTLPTPVTGLCKFWIRLAPFIESGDLSVAEFNDSHPLTAPFDPFVTVPSELRLEAYFDAIIKELGAFEAVEGSARAAVRAQYVSDANKMIETVMVERLDILNSKSEIAFRLVDSAARTRLIEMRTVVGEEHQRFRGERVAEINFLKHQILNRHDAIIRLAVEFARSETEDAQLPPHELADMRIYHRKVTDRIRKGLKAEREALLSEVRWHAGQGNHLRHLLRDYLDGSNQLSLVSHVQVQEEIVRGYGWYHMVRYREDEDDAGGQQQQNGGASSIGKTGGGDSARSSASSRTGGVAGLGMGIGGGGATPARIGNGGQGQRSGAWPQQQQRAQKHQDPSDFDGILAVPALPVGTSEVYVSIVEEEESAWNTLVNEIEGIIARTRTTANNREEVTEELEYFEEVERFIVQEETWREYMLMREGLEFDAVVETWRRGVPLTIEELEQRSRITIEDRASRWLAATIGLVAVLIEEGARRAFIKTTIYNMKSWVERYELLGRATIEVDECRCFHRLIIQWSERKMRGLLLHAEETERSVLEDLLAAGPDVPAELLMMDARLEPTELALAELDPFAWQSSSTAQNLLYRRPSSFYGGSVPDRIRRSGSSRSLSLVSDSFRASASAAASAVLREDIDARPSDSREKKKRQQ